MKCSICGTDMKGGYSLVLGYSGTIRIQALPVEENIPSPDVYICPNCGKVELSVDLKNLRPKPRSLISAVKQWFKGYDQDPK